MRLFSYDEVQALLRNFPLTKCLKFVPIGFTRRYLFSSRLAFLCRKPLLAVSLQMRAIAVVALNQWDLSPPLAATKLGRKSLMRGHRGVRESSLLLAVSFSASYVSISRFLLSLAVALSSRRASGLVASPSTYFQSRCAFKCDSICFFQSR